jgi:hypothetical protein
LAIKICELLDYSAIGWCMWSNNVCMSNFQLSHMKLCYTIHQCTRTYTPCILLASLADQGLGWSGVISCTLGEYHQPKLEIQCKVNNNYSQNTVYGATIAHTLYIPYSRKFSWGPIFADGQSPKFSRFNFRGCGRSCPL